MEAAPTDRLAELVPFVPRLTLDWLRDHPERLWVEQDATIAFVDISGFTAMSEKLSNLGKAGAEEVTDVMNTTFSALLEVAYAEGGGLLKFGGDALLLLYTGPEHAARAARACFGMRRVLRTVGRPRTSAGAIQLRMHAGVHSGTFQFFLVGDSHRELLVTGPAATRTVEMEATSEAGEIVVSPETAALLDEAVLGDQKGDGRLLVGEPQASGEMVPTPDVEGVPLETAIPAPLRSQLLDVGPLEGEHRNGAIAFVRFSGLDEIVGTEGPDAAADALDALVRAIQAAADEHGVTFLESDVDRDGGRIILVSGAPRTFGDDEERLLRVLRVAVDTGLPLPVHVGANRGRFFTGQVGAPFRRTYTVLGDTAALAARLMARAGEDEIYVSAEALARGGGCFAADALEPFTVKGKSEPVHAHLLGEIVEATPDGAAPGGGRGLPFVDRERERAVLDAAVAPVRMGFGTLVELIGEPGIGKSRLAEELETRCADMGKVGTRCQQYESGTPYHPFRPVLRSLLDIELNGDAEQNRTLLAERVARIDEELVPWVPLFAAPLDAQVASTPEVDALDPAFWRARLHGVLGKLLGHVLDAPTLLLFEDVHWMDDASSELLRFLGTQLPTKPWLACTTRRPVEGGFAAAEGTPPLPAMTLRLEALPETDARTLALAAAGDRRLSEDELEAIAARAAGNPLFLQELASPEERSEDEALPETVEALVATKIDRLAPADRALLRWASVLGVSFSGSVIAQVLEDDETASASSEAWDRLAEFVERDPEVPGGFRFRHALIRDAAYEGLSYRRRRELHTRVAEVLEQRQERGEIAELLSLHFHYGERWEETWRYSVVAARRAWDKFANVEAARFYERALGAARQGAEVPKAEVAEVWEGLGDARMRLGEYEQAGEAFRESRRVSDAGPVEEARLMQKEAVASFRLNRHPQALRRLTQAQRLLEGVEGQDAAQQRARLLGWYAGVLQRQKRPGDVVEWCERAIQEATGANALDALAQAYFLLDWAYVALGRPADAVYSVRAIAIYEELGNFDLLAWVLNNLGGYTYLEGRWDEAIELAERARDTFRKIGDDTHALIAALNIAEVRSDQGRGEEVDLLFREAVEARRAGGIAIEIAEAVGLLGRHEARVGNFAEARTLLAEARSLYEEGGDDFDLLTTDLRLVECLVLEGKPDEALRIATRALADADDVAGVSVLVAALHRHRGSALAQSGDREAARAAFAESLATARAGGENYGLISNDYEVALTLDALARLERLDGNDAGGLEAERDETLTRLGVVRLPEPPAAA
ncbi:MAG TPA: tetratricopeptide repeat protein, partial [Gaiellaceae bacterium]|nr:tetratricopeptide repeat protein [Gaiellaceae bacterium]